ncbi:MAG: hypothetical protein KC457_00255 [Myxococcales bacterium]|nr:hypothetical protein [Myxococcales bacterium]
MAEDDDEPGGPLALREVARPPDAYEAEYMAGEGTVLYRDKSRAPWPLHAIMALAGLGIVIPALMAPGGILGAALGLPVLGLVWMLFSVLRVTVSEGHINVQYGLFGPKIPIAAVESAEAVQYDWTRFGGWGIRMNRDGEWIYNMPGDGGRAVKVVWRDGKGKRRVTYIGSAQSENLAEQIGVAQAALPPGARQASLPSGD